MKHILNTEYVGFIYSMFLYGSVAQFELNPGISDIDLIMVLKPNTVVSADILQRTNNIIQNTVANNKNIRTSVHIWNYEDFENKTVYPDDCSLINSFTRLRQNITIYVNSY
jgi:predicted nucleotidyltransferase